MGKESKALIEMYAKQTGKPAEEVAADIAKMYGYQKSDVPLPTGEEGKMSPIMAAILEAKKAELEMQKAGVGAGEVSPTIKMAMEMMIMMPLMNKLSGQGQDAAPNITDLLARNDAKWEHRLEQDKAERKEEALQARLDKLELLVTSGKKDDPMIEKVLAEIKETKTELKESEKARIKAELDAKDDKITSLKDYIDDSLAAIQNQAPQKSADEGFFEMMDKMSKFDDMVRRRGKALGMTDEQIEKEVAEATPMKQQIVKDVFKTINRYIDAIAGKKGTEEPETMAEISQEVAKVVCKRCGTQITGGDVCQPCYDIFLAEKAQAEVEAMKRPERPADAEVEVQVSEPESPTTL